jgi:hypothetical protein
MPLPAYGLKGLYVALITLKVLIVYTEVAGRARNVVWLFV